jgi:small subunit ribosomal protein S20
LRSTYRTHIKKVLNFIESGKKDEALTAYKAATPIIDSMVNKGIMHKNKASRHKSRLSARIKKMSTEKK